MSMAGCSSPPKLHGSSPPAGHQAPINAVSGFLRELLAGDPMALCGYVDPNEEGNCLISLGNVGPATGSWRVDNSVVAGGQAIVAVEFADFCLQGQCVTATNPNAGLPHSSTPFATAFERTQDGTSAKPVIGAFGCIRSHGQWYVELPIPGLI
jgi:hypothetical protein